VCCCCSCYQTQPECGIHLSQPLVVDAGRGMLSTLRGLISWHRIPGMHRSWTTTCTVGPNIYGSWHLHVWGGWQINVRKLWTPDVTAIAAIVFFCSFGNFLIRRRKCSCFDVNDSNSDAEGSPEGVRHFTLLSFSVLVSSPGISLWSMAMSVWFPLGRRWI
jgi:hypothetical protein